MLWIGIRLQKVFGFFSRLPLFKLLAIHQILSANSNSIKKYVNESGYFSSKNTNLFSLFKWGTTKIPQAVASFQQRPFFQEDEINTPGVFSEFHPGNNRIELPFWSCYIYILIAWYARAGKISFSKVIRSGHMHFKWGRMNVN